MFLKTFRNPRFIRGILIWQPNYFCCKVDIIKLFERKHETEIMGQRSKPSVSCVESCVESLTGKREPADGIFFVQLMKISQEVKPSNNLEDVLKTHFRLVQSLQQYVICMKFALYSW